MNLDKKLDDFFTIFLFPFAFDAGNPEKIKKLVDALCEKGWKAPDSFNLGEHYDEYVYFHPFVRDAIFLAPTANRNGGADGSRFLTRAAVSEKEPWTFELYHCCTSRKDRIAEIIWSDKLSDLKEHEEAAFNKCFDAAEKTPDKLFAFLTSLDVNVSERIANEIKKAWSGGELIVNKKTEKNIPDWLKNAWDHSCHITCISVNVTDIDLHLFDNGIGLLSMTTRQHSNEQNRLTVDQALRFNDLARRVYAPFLGHKVVDGVEHPASTDNPKNANMLPVAVRLFNGNEKNGKGFIEDFKTPKFECGDLSECIKISEIITRLLEPMVCKPYKNPAELQDVIHWFSPFTDDRMFIITAFLDNDIARVFHAQAKKRPRWIEDDTASDLWYRMIFVDGGDATIENDRMKQKILKRHTYARWLKYKTIYGLSEYSLVLSAEAGDYTINLKRHMHAMYYQMAVMVLMQKTMLLKFSRDIYHVVKRFDKFDEALLEKTKELHGEFIRHINKYWFIEVTPQQQGVEMYRQWLKVMNMDNLYKEVRQEIADMSGFVKSEIEKQRRDAEGRTHSNTCTLTRWGLPLLALPVLWEAFGKSIEELVEHFVEAYCSAFLYPSILPPIIYFAILLLAFIVLGDIVKRRLQL